jgi:hypothetical protein
LCFRNAIYFRNFLLSNTYFKFLSILETARLSIHVGDLHGTQPITLRTDVYETLTYGGVRGAVRQFLAEPSTRLAVVPILTTRLTIEPKVHFRKIQMVL